MGTQVRTYVQEKYVVKKSNGLVKQESAHERGKGVDTAKSQDKEDVLHHVGGDASNNDEEDCIQGPCSNNEERFGFIIIGPPAEANDTNTIKFSTRETTDEGNKLTAHKHTKGWFGIGQDIPSSPLAPVLAITTIIPEIPL